MRYTNLGRTGLQVSKICLGCMGFGNNKLPGWGWVLEMDDAGPFYRRAVELGINFFDTADSYSGGRSEEITGHWLKEYARRDEVVIATKVYFGPGDRPNMTGLSRKHIQQACEASLRRLGVETRARRLRKRWRRSITSWRRARCATSARVRCMPGNLCVHWGFQIITVGRVSWRCRIITTCSTARKNAI